MSNEETLTGSCHSQSPNFTSLSLTTSHRWPIRKPALDDPAIPPHVAEVANDKQEWELWEFAQQATRSNGVVGLASKREDGYWFGQLVVDNDVEYLRVQNFRDTKTR
jgi:hypothetical protein